MPRVGAAAKFPIGCVDGGSYDIDDDLAGPRHGVGQVAVVQDLGAAEMIEQSCFHALSLTIDNLP